MLPAQSVIVFGNITNNGVAAPNYPVTISGPNYTSTVLTDASGNYRDTALVNTTQGGITVTVVDCRMQTLADSSFFNPGSTTIGPINFDICPMTGAACASNFSYSVNGLAATFVDASRASTPLFPITSWNWDFGDGGTSTSQNPSHTYAAAGTYTVCLIISDGSCTDTSCQVLTVPSTGGGNCAASFIQRLVSGTTVSFTNTSMGGSPPFTYVWDFGDGNTSTQANPTHTYNSTGPFTACLTITDSNGCIDSTCQQVVISTPPGCSAAFSMQVSGMSVQFIDGSVGLGPAAVNSYQWDFGNGNTSTVQNPSQIYTNPGTYTVCLIFSSAAFGMACIDTTCATVTITGPMAASIYGNVMLTAMRPGDSAIVYLITHDSTAGTLTAIDSTYTSPNGGYTFNNVANGDYRTKAALLPGHSLYAGTLPTYHDSDTYWSNATVITVSSNTLNQADITMVNGMNPGGPGFIGGLISQGANKRDPGDPIENVSILLFDDLDNPITHTVTDANGEYSFPNLAYGTYKVHVEVLGKTSTDQYVTISAASSAISNIDFHVNSQTVDISTAIDAPTFGSVLNLYPNPTSSTLHLELELKNTTNLNISIIDQVGRILQQETRVLGSGAQEISMNLENLPMGIYQLSLRANGEVLTKRIVKK